MGLDMYLSKRKYVKNWSHEAKEKHHTITIKRGGKTVSSKLPIKEVVYEAAYWRKANAIHKWFVDNCQGGEDDCRDAYVSAEQLQELVDLCKKVLATAKTAEGKVQNGTRWTPEGGEEKILEDGITITNPEELHKLLPTESGFFFGSTDYDQWYLEDIKSTIEQLEAALSDKGSDGEFGAEFTYHSSW